MSQYEAAQLFIERALFHLPAFAVTNANAPALASLCHRLDGIPLAIELAAARARSLSVEEINSKLDNRFSLLTGGSRAALPRQQTLRALIDWSYDLLTAREKTLLCRLSVFAGGWTLEACEQVGAEAGETGEIIEDWEVLDLLTSLADKSLLVTEQQQGQTRYRLLETVRQYAWDRLAESGGSLPARARHGDYFGTLAEEIKPKLFGSEQAQWFGVLETEHDNLRQALALYAQASAQVAETGEKGLRLGAALAHFWQVRGHLGEGREHLRAALAHPGAQEPTQARAGALMGAGLVAYHLGDYAGARALYEESLRMARASGNKPHIALCLVNLGTVASRLGDDAGGRLLFEESLTIARALGSKYDIALCLVNLGDLTISHGDYAGARVLLGEGMTIASEAGYRTIILSSLEAFAALAGKEAQEARGVHLRAAAAALRETLGAPLPPADREKQEREMTEARKRLGDDAFALALTEGSALIMEQAVTFALET